MPQENHAISVMDATTLNEAGILECFINDPGINGNMRIELHFNAHYGHTLENKAYPLFVEADQILHLADAIRQKKEKHDQGKEGRDH